MKKNVLALSIAAMIGGLGFAGAASAEVVPGTATFVAGTTMDTTNATVLQITDAGTGHNLLVPYFNAQNGNMSVFHVVNTDTVNGKATKVRFRSASNSDDILDFQVFLSPGDVWTAAVTQGADGVAQIVTNDNTCTVPTLTAGVPQSFVKNRLNNRLSNADQANHTREGYVEIFNMADIPPVTATPTVTPATSLYLATKHANAVAPCSVAGSPARTLLDTIATTNYATEATASAAGFNTPSTGLMGDWYIINVPQTTTFSGAATSVTARVGVNGVAGRGNFVHFPQTEVPVAAAQVLNFTADPLFRTDARAATAGNGGDYAAATVGTAAIAAASYDLPDMSTPYTVSANNAPVDAQSPLVQAGLLTSALAVTSVANQYATDPTISAKTDWVFSMPTRRYSVAANYAAVSNTVPATNAPTYRLFSTLVTPAGAPAVQWFRPGNTSTDALGNICVNANGQRFFDREESTPGATGTPPVFSPGNPSAPSVVRFCGETSVLAFKDDTLSVLGADVARTTITSGVYTNGWGNIDTGNSGAGLPILGSSFIKLTNPNVGNNVSGTYGITWPHRFTRVQTVN
jgi:hypothetical protein